MTTKNLEIKSKLAPTPANSPHFSVEIKDSTGKAITLADPQATRGLLALMNLTAVNGGAACHWGGPAALAEIMSALHGILFEEKDWFERYNFVNDEGHTENGVYALRANYGYDSLKFEDLWGFRSIESKLTGHGESHLNPEGVLLSNGPLGSSVAQAQGLAMADKLCGKKRATFLVLSDGASMEGEAKETFSSLPGLAAKGKVNPFIMIISDNNTKLSGRIDEDAFSMNPTFESLSTLGWDLRKIEDGHNLEKLYSEIQTSLRDAEKNPSKPICLWVKTIKGYGVKSTEASSSGGHGYPLKAFDENISSFLDEIFSGSVPQEFQTWTQQILSGKPKTSDSRSEGVKKEKAQAGLARGAINSKQNGLPVVSISADLQGSTGMQAFRKEFPESSFEVGVAESNMVSVGAGFSKGGYLPIVDTFAQFGITKGNLPLIMANLSQAPITCVFSHTGFQDAADGASHQATTYISALASIPGTVLVNTSCSSEGESLMTQALERQAEQRKNNQEAESVVFFVGRENFPATFESTPKFEWGKAQILKQGQDLVIVGNGPMIFKALAAAEELAQAGISATVLNHPFLNQFDKELLKSQLAANKGNLLTIEDHQVKGGFGSLLCHFLSREEIPFKIRSLGVEGEFGRSAYKADQLYDKYGLGVRNVVDTARTFF